MGSCFFFFITPQLSAVRFPETDDAVNAAANRETDVVDAPAKFAQCDETFFAIIPSTVDPFDRTAPVEFPGIPEIPAMLCEVAPPFGLVPFEQDN
jgi:hypothetical protein